MAQQLTREKYLKDAARVVLENKTASISLIQRKLSVGYCRGSEIIDMLEEEGFISAPKEESRQRDVLITPEQFKEIFGEEFNS